MDSFLVQNLTNPILTYSKKGGSIDFRGPPNLSNPWSCTKNIWPRGLFNYFLPGSTEWKCPFCWKKKKKSEGWQVSGEDEICDRNSLFPSLSLSLSLCYLSFLRAWLTAWIVLWLLNRWFTGLGSADVSCLALLKYRTLKDFFLLKNHFTASDCHKITSAMFPNNNLCFYPVSKVYPSLHFILLKVRYLYLKVTLKPKFTSACVSSLLEMRKVHPLPPFASHTFQDVGDEMSISGNQTSVMSQRTLLKLLWYVS